MEEAANYNDNDIDRSSDKVADKKFKVDKPEASSDHSKIPAAALAVAAQLATVRVISARVLIIGLVTLYQ